MMKGQKGITLVALVITIIVMLILVGVSVTVALEGGLFDSAKAAGNQYEAAAKEEQAGNLVKVNETIMNITDAVEEYQERTAE